MSVQNGEPGTIALSLNTLPRTLAPALVLNRRWSFILSKPHYCKPRPILFINPVLRLLLETALFAQKSQPMLMSKILRQLASMV